jgi:xanthine dehydrogenase/oxidase
MLNSLFRLSVDSQAVGEPPLFLAASVFFAIREAIASYRRDNGLTGHFQLDSPATSERIRLLCHDQFTQKVTSY